MLNSIGSHLNTRRTAPGALMLALMATPFATTSLAEGNTPATITGSFS